MCAAIENLAVLRNDGYRANDALFTQGCGENLIESYTKIGRVDGMQVLWGVHEASPFEKVDPGFGSLIRSCLAIYPSTDRVNADKSATYYPVHAILI